MQRSLSLLTDLHSVKKSTEEDDDSQDYQKSRGSDVDADEEEEINDLEDDEAQERKIRVSDPSFSPRKACVEEVANFSAGGLQFSRGQTLDQRGEKQDKKLRIEVPGVSTAAEDGSSKAGPSDADLKLRRAILDGDVQAARSVIEGISDSEEQLAVVNHVSGKDAFTPLMIAVSTEEEKADVDLVQLLLRKGCDRDAVDRKGNTCLHWAAVHGQSKVIRDIIKGIEDIGTPNHAGDTPLHLASRYGRLECCRIFLSYFSSESEGDTTGAVKDNSVADTHAGETNGSVASNIKIKNEDPMIKSEKPNASVDSAMAKLLDQKEAGENTLASGIQERRRKEKVDLESLMQESKQNAIPPHPILVLRNANFETAFEVAGIEVSLEDVGTGTPAMVKMQKAAFSSNVRKTIHMLFFEASPYFKTLILHHFDCLDHVPFGEDGRDIWEAPERLHAILRGIKENLAEDHFLMSTNFPTATPEMLKRAHSKEYVDFVCGLEKKVQISAVPFTPLVQRRLMNFDEKDLKKAEHSDTSFSPGSLKAALRACGSVCHAIDQVVQKLQRNAFCVVRPPGHHAGINGLLQTASSCGFCIFNNVMVGALHAMEKFPDKIKRIAIVDFDVHHGNGTEEIVAKINRDAIQKNIKNGKPGSPPILFFSSHVYDAQRPGSAYEFYPGSGQFCDTLGNIINAPMQPLWRRRGYRKNIDGRRSWAERFYFEHFGRVEFRRIIKERLVPALRSFEPDLILLSAGFDASRRDVGNSRFMGKYCSGFDLQQQDFMWIAGQINQVASVACDGRVVSVLEGGYGRLEGAQSAPSAQYTIDRHFLARNCVAHVNGLIDPRAKMDADESESEESDDGKESMSKDTEEKLNQRRARTRRPPKRFEGQDSAKGRRRKRGDSSGGESDDLTGKKKKRSKKEDEAEEARAQTHKRSQALEYLKQVKAKFADDASKYKEFLLVMGNFKKGEISVDRVVDEVKRLFEGDHALIEGFNAFLPNGYVIKLDSEAGTRLERSFSNGEDA